MKGLLAAGLTAALALAVLSDSLLPALWPGLFSIVLFVLTSLAMTGVGRRLIGRFGIDFTEEEKTVAGATLGLGVTSLAMLILAAAGLLQTWVISLLLAVFWIYSFPEAFNALQTVRFGFQHLKTKPWLFVLLTLPISLVFLCTLVPPHQYDSLVYHLALPQQYLQAGRLFAPEGTVFCHFPQNAEMIFTLALALKSDLLAQMYIWFAMILSIAWVLTFGRRLLAGYIGAAVLIATHTSVLNLSSTTYVEPLVMLWATAAILTLESFKEQKSNSPVILAAIFTGLALGTKYYAGLLALALTIRLLWDRRFQQALIFTTVVSLIFSPWLIKNWVTIGNPVFPFLYKLLPATRIGWTEQLAGGYFQVLTEYGHGQGLAKDLISLPILLFRNPLRYGGGMDVLGDLGWDLTLWLWAYGVWVAFKIKNMRGLAILSLIYFTGWFLTGVVLRFLTALVPLMALIAVLGVTHWQQTASVWAKRVAAISGGAIICSHLFLFLFVQGVFGSEKILLSLEDREAFLTKKLDYYPCAVEADKLIKPGYKMLVVGEQRGYYISVPYQPSTVHAPNYYITTANNASSTEDLVSTLKSAGFSHLLFVPREAQRLGQSLGVLTEQGSKNWDGLEKHLRLIKRGPACLLAELEGA